MRGFAAIRHSGVHRRLPGELWRDLDQGLVDQHGHRIEVAGVGLQAQALRLQRDGTAAGKRVEQRRGLAAGRVFADLGPRLFQQRLVVDILPLHQLPDQVEQPLPLSLLGILGGK